MDGLAVLMQRNFAEDPFGGAVFGFRGPTCRIKCGLRAEIDKLHILIKGHHRHRFGKRSERLDAEQLQLVIEDIEQTMGAGAAAEDARLKANTRHKTSVKPVRRQCNLGQLPDSFPRLEVVIDLGGG